MTFSKLAALCGAVLTLAGCSKNPADAPVAPADVAGCAGSLRMIAAAKSSWADATRAAAGATPTWDDLDRYFPHGRPKCPTQGAYTLGTIDELPKCSVAAHSAYFAQLMTNPPPTQ